MKKNLILRLCLMMVVCLTFYSCRQENFLLDQHSHNQDVKYYVTKNIQNNKNLLNKVSNIQKSLTNDDSRFSSKTIADSLLQGANILTDQVLVAEKNGHKTYTFQLKRNYPTQNIENIVLKKNNDSTYSGVLIQYRISHIDKLLLHRGDDIDLKSKTKIYKINDFAFEYNSAINNNLNAKSGTKTFTYTVDCYTFTYQPNPCVWCGRAFGNTECKKIGQPGAAQAPTLISVENNCDGSSGTGSGEIPTDPLGNYPGSGVPNDDGTGYDTLIFASIGYQYFSTEDLNDPNYVLYNQVAGLFGTVMSGDQNNNIRQANPDLFYYSFLYFQEHGFNNTTKAFVSERLTGLVNWYKSLGDARFGFENQLFFNWAYRYLLRDNPDISWQEFYNEYLATPCQKTKAMLQNPEIQTKIDELKIKAKETKGEKGFMVDKDGNPSAIIDGGDHQVNLGSVAGWQGAYHNHTPAGIKMHSPPDVAALLKFALAQPQGQQNNAYLGMLGYQVCSVCTGGYIYRDYVIYFNGSLTDAGKTFTKDQLKTLMNDYIKMEKDLTDSSINGTTYVDANGYITNIGLEKLFFDTLVQMGLEGKVSLQRIEDGIVKTVTLNPDGKTTTATPCPN